MRVPAFLYGEYRNVKPLAQRNARALSAGIHVEDLADGQWVDTQSVEGLLVLEGPSRGLPPGPHFHLFALGVAANDLVVQRKAPEGLLAVLYEEGIRHPWSLLGLLGQHGLVFLLRNPAWWRALLKSAAEFWPELDSQGRRYTLGSAAPADLWSLPTNIGGALVQLGLPVEEIRRPLPPGGLGELAIRVVGETS